MTTRSQGPDPGDRGGGSGFAEVLNGLTLSGKRRKRDRPARQQEPPPAWPDDERGWPPEPDHGGQHRDGTQGYVQDHGQVQDRGWPAPPPAEEPDDDASFVRPYAWTGGRTKSTVELRLETLLSTTDRARDGRFRLQAEHQAVAELCGRPRSVAEVSSLMCVPLGVAKVLLGDMAELGLVIVHKTAHGGGNASHLKLMERVLSGLRRL